MFKISEFSEITKVPVKTIRYYQELGLLRPAEVDEITGYRRFDEKNIEDLLKIVYLKNLGFKLAEIKDFDDNALKSKLKELKREVSKLKENISNITNLYKNKKGEYIMKNFINDENLIGKWHLIGLADTEEDLKNGIYHNEKTFGLNNLTFLPNGESVWVITFWTKGYIFIKDVPMKYFYLDGKLVIAFDYDVSGEVEVYAIYENVDHKKYTIDEVQIKDDINKEFIDDEKLRGIWKSCGFVKNIEEFDKDFDYTQKWNLWYKNLVILNDGNVIVSFSNGESNSDCLKWTKDYIMAIYDKTAQHYVIKNIDGKDYLFMEHKSGDYSFGELKPYYYVFKKES